MHNSGLACAGLVERAIERHERQKHAFAPALVSSHRLERRKLGPQIIVWRRVGLAGSGLDQPADPLRHRAQRRRRQSGCVGSDHRGGGLAQEAATNLVTDRPHVAVLQVEVEGHTDDLPISSARYPSNWELSTARAGAAARYLIDHGVPAARIRAVGYAETRPLVPNDSRENRGKNRRVEFLFARDPQEAEAAPGDLTDLRPAAGE